eukprot:4524512-Pleurochrysis_carterae.AAC.1
MERTGKGSGEHAIVCAARQFGRFRHGPDSEARDGPRASCSREREHGERMRERELERGKGEGRRIVEWEAEKDRGRGGRFGSCKNPRGSP